jgi:hypothetical protein
MRSAGGDAASVPFFEAGSAARVHRASEVLGQVVNAMEEETELKAELDRLRHEHRDLDAEIELLQADQRTDQLTLRRLKKRKLQLKDQMARIEDQLYPDIIA